MGKGGVRASQPGLASRVLQSGPAGVVEQGGGRSRTAFAGGPGPSVLLVTDFEIVGPGAGGAPATVAHECLGQTTLESGQGAASLRVPSSSLARDGSCSRVQAASVQGDPLYRPGGTASWRRRRVGPRDLHSRRSAPSRLARSDGAPDLPCPCGEPTAPESRRHLDCPRSGRRPRRSCLLAEI